MSSDSIQDLRYLANLMDQRFRGPFGWRFGWDGVLGLVPVVGDLVTNSVSIYILVRAAQLGCSASVIARMGLNLLIENVVDVIPLFGNLFDFVWKANSRNLALVEDYLRHPRRTTLSSRMVVAAVVGLVLLFMVAILVLALYALRIFLNFLEPGWT